MLKLSSVLLFAISFGCARVEIRDGELCGDMGQDGAACFHTLSDAERDLTAPEWNVTRFGWICGSSQSISEMLAALEKLCSLTWRCSHEEKRVIERLSARVHALQERAFR